MAGRRAALAATFAAVCVVGTSCLPDGSPIAGAGSEGKRSNRFDVYLGEGALTYVKNPCDQADTEPHFFLHIDPVDRDDLPEHRQHYGFDNLDFAFSKHGNIFDGKCMATVWFPEYAISAIRTGQFIPDGPRIWEDELRPPTSEEGNARRRGAGNQVRRAAYAPGRTVTLRTHLYALEVGAVDLEPFPAGGGAIEPLGDGLLVGTPDGRLALVSADSAVEYLDGQVPMNRSGMESHDLYRDDALRRLFRVTDILLKGLPGEAFELFVTHHYFADGCTSFRLSSTTLLLQEDDLPVLSPWRTVFDAEPCLIPWYSGAESGGKMVTDGPDHLLVAVGDHGKSGRVQDPDSHLGKLVRIEIETGRAEVWSLGHRNPQGLARDADGGVWATEHGPQGGDELNLLERGANHGWPQVSYGVQYGGRRLNDSYPVGRHDGFARPVFAWTPSIAISSIVVNDERWFPLWKDDLLVGSLDGRSNATETPHGWSLFRVRRHGRQAQYVEKIPLGVPVRDMAYMSDGRLAMLEGFRGRILLARRSDAYCGDESGQRGSVYALHCEAPPASS